MKTFNLIISCGTWAIIAAAGLVGLGICARALWEFARIGWHLFGLL